MRANRLPHLLLQAGAHPCTIGSAYLYGYYLTCRLHI
jgi:hypothetical protein